LARYLLDTSALYPLLLRLGDRIIDYAHLLAVLDLTLYEAGNTVWKEHRAGRVRRLEPVTRLLEEFFSSVEIIRIEPRDITGIARLAVEEGLTFYDASYLYTARMKGLRLVTEDKDLKPYRVSMGVEEFTRLVEEAEPGGEHP